MGPCFLFLFFENQIVGKRHVDQIGFIHIFQRGTYAIALGYEESTTFFCTFLKKKKKALS